MSDPENMRYWDKFKTPPESAAKKITAGRLKGKNDINPQWRFQVMTEVFGPYGVDWKVEIVKLWTDALEDGQVLCHAHVNVYYREGDEWEAPIPGVGGDFLVQKESAGLHANDEGYKMAVTDAIGKALTMLGVAAEVYLGVFDTKYSGKPERPAPREGGAAKPKQAPLQETEDPDDFVITFGKKHPDKTLWEIAGPKEEGCAGDRGYLHYLLDNINGKEEQGEKLSARDSMLKDALLMYFDKHPSKSDQGE